MIRSMDQTDAPRNGNLVSVPWITRHAIDRYVERVEPTLSASIARRRLQQILVRGRWRPTPRRWMRGHCQLTPGLRFVYWSGQPDVCVLVRGGAVVTVLTRSLLRRWKRQLTLEPGGLATPIYALDANGENSRPLPEAA